MNELRVKHKFSDGAMSKNFCKKSTTDKILLLYPYDVATETRTGSHPGKTFRADGSTQAFDGRTLYFQSEDRVVSDIESLHRALVSAAEEGKSFVVRGRRSAPKMKFFRRTKRDIEKTPAGLADARHFWIPVDVDHLPNAWGDPRIDATEIQREILGLLGISRLSVSFSWSSSCCRDVPSGEAPKDISCRIWIWCDRRVGEHECRTLLKRIDARVKLALSELGFETSKKMIIDSKLADCVQPIYVAAPRFEAGAVDVMVRVSRWSLIKGEVDTLDLEALYENLPEISVNSPTLKEVCGTKRTRGLQVRSKSVHIARTPVPLTAAKREIEAAREALDAKTYGDFRHKCNGFGQARIALEMTALANYRGGLEAGTRNDFVLHIAAAVVASLPLGLPVGRVKAEVRAVARLAVSDGWITDEWETNGDVSVIERYLRASTMEENHKLARSNDPRYAYGFDRLRDEWMATEDEVRALGLISLAPRAINEKLRREASGARDRRDYIMNSRRHAPEVHRLRVEGLSYHAIAKELAINSKSTIYQLAQLSVEELEEVRVWLAEQEDLFASDEVADKVDSLVVERPATASGSRHEERDIGKLASVTPLDLRKMRALA